MLQIPERTDEVAKLQSYVRRFLPGLDPTVTRRRGFIGGFVRSLGSALHDWYVSLKRFADREPWPQTATEGFFKIGWWLDITELPRRPAAAAQGSIVLTGTAGTIVPAGTEITGPTSAVYTTDTSVVLVAQTLRGTSSLTVDGRGQFVTGEPHNLATGQTLTFSGMLYTDLDGTFAIRVDDANTVSYDPDAVVSGAPVEPNPIISGTWANVIITAAVAGVAGNIDAGGSLTVVAPPDGLDAEALVTFGGVADGSEVETLESWRARVLEGLAIDFGMFSPAEIQIVAKTVPGVTRVFVRTPVRSTYDDAGLEVRDGVGSDGYPTEGRCRIAFLRDNDADPIPSALEVAQVRAALAPLIPAHTFPDDVEVLAPERYALQVRFHSITPDTPGMRASVRANVRQFLLEEATWGGVLSIEGLRCAIRASFDTETGQALRAYSLDTPTMDIAMPVDAYPVLASITWTA